LVVHLLQNLAALATPLAHQSLEMPVLQLLAWKPAPPYQSVGHLTSPLLVLLLLQLLVLLQKLGFPSLFVLTPVSHLLEVLVLQFVTWKLAPLYQLQVPPLLALLVLQL
jgi:hypothetical protein